MRANYTPYDECGANSCCEIFFKDKASVIQDMLAEEMAVSLSTESSKQGQRQRALVILHQMIDDAHKGKRQFLSGNFPCIKLGLISYGSGYTLFLLLY